MSNPLVQAARRVESAHALDHADRVLHPLVRTALRNDRWRSALRGDWLGHAVHPLMTDFPLGMWMSGTLLDLVAGPSSRPASRRLIGMGILAALPTALTGAAGWGAIEPVRDRRTGLVHAAVNSTALALYTGSWLARRRGDHVRGTALAVGGGVAATIGGYFGGHLTEVRKVSSRHPSFDSPAMGHESRRAQ
jgi:uncharacterized membrane protein